MGKLQRYPQEDSKDQVSWRGRAVTPRMGFAPEGSAFTPSRSTRAGFSLGTNCSEVFKSPTPMGSESTCKTSSLSPRVRDVLGSDAGIDRIDESESFDAPAPGIHGRACSSLADDMFRSEVKVSSSSLEPSSSGGTEHRSIEEPWTWFDSPKRNEAKGLQRNESFKIIIVFRGGWCDTSRTLLKGFAELNQRVKRAGGKLVAVSSQTPEQVAKTAKDYKLTFSAYGDPTNALIERLNQRLNIACEISRNDIVIDAYPQGMAQPCVVAVMADESPSERSVLFKWERWQTIGTLKHDSALTQIIREFSRRTQRPLPPGVGPYLTSTPRTTNPIPNPVRPAHPAVPRPPSLGRRRPVTTDAPDRYNYGSRQLQSGSETPRRLRVSPLGTAPTPLTPAASVSSEHGSHRGRARSIDDAVNEALRRHTNRSDHRTPRDGNPTGFERQTPLQPQPQPPPHPHPLMPPPPQQQMRRFSEPGSSVASSYREYQAYQAPESAWDSSGRPLMHVREMTQSRVITYAAAPSRREELDEEFAHEEDVAVRVKDGGKPPPRPQRAPFMAPSNLEDLEASVEVDRGGWDGDRTQRKPGPTPSNSRWQVFGRSAIGRGEPRRPSPARQQQQQQQPQQQKPPTNRKSWVCRRDKYPTPASDFSPSLHRPDEICEGVRGVSANGSAAQGNPPQAQARAPVVVRRLFTRQSGE